MSFQSLGNRFQGTVYSPENHPDIEVENPRSPQVSDSEIDENDVNFDEVNETNVEDLEERSEINRKILSNQPLDDSENECLTPLQVAQEIVSTSESYQTLTQSDASETEDADEFNEADEEVDEFQSQPQSQSQSQSKTDTLDVENELFGKRRTRGSLFRSNNQQTKETKLQNSTAQELKTNTKDLGRSVSSLPPIHKKMVKPSNQSQKIRVLSFNLWFDEKDRLGRAQQIIHLIKKQQLEIVGLQEVVPETFELLEKYLKHDYLIFQIFIEEKLHYGDCLLFHREKIRIIEPYFYDYPKTAMSRKVIGCEIQIRGLSEKMHILNTHLESGRNGHEFRHHQIQVIQEIISKNGIKNVILLGDLNITSLKESAETLLQQSDLQDAWITMGCPSELKYTYDYRRNSRISGKFRARLDRILYHLRIDHLLTGLKLVGVTHELPPPSDHFGIQAEFVFKSIK